MIRIFFLLVIILLFFIIAKRFIAFINQQSNQQKSTSEPERMVKCELCGTHILESESATLNQQVVCKNQPCVK